MTKDIIKLHFSGDVAVDAEAMQAVCARLGAEIDEAGICVNVQKSEKGLTVKYDGEYKITYSKKPELFRALAIMLQKIRNGENDFSVCEEAKIETSGVMVDLSRSAVMKTEAIKDVIERMAIMGLNMLMLYTEDIYKLEKYPYFGYMRGAYTKEELKDLDAYALKFGVELIPCIQTLGHLRAPLRWREFSDMKDTPTVLLAGEEKTYELIEEMLKTCREVFTTDRIHIGMDEANDIGTGGFFKRNGYVPAAEIMNSHLKRVTEITDKYGYKPMLWSDMFFTSNNKEKYYYIPETQFSEEYKNDIPKNVQMVYWDYEGDHEERYEKMIEAHKRLDKEIVFAGAAWSWNRLAPNFQKTFMASRASLNACKEYGVKTAFMTMWGNSGMQVNFYQNLPAVQLWADLTYNNDVSDEELAENFAACTGYNLDDFMLLSCDDFPVEDIIENIFGYKEVLCINTSYQIFYQDVLYGLIDKNLRDYDFKAHYKEYLDKISKVGDCGDMNDIFELHKHLYSFIYHKSDIGIRLTDAYCAGDKKLLAELSGEVVSMLDELKTIHGLYYKIWHKINRPFGWDHLDMRLGALSARLESAVKRVGEYLSGDVEALPEFEAERLYYNGYDKAMFEVNSPDSFDRPCSWD